MSALLFFDVWASWHLQEVPAGANVWLTGFVCCWIWLDALDRDDA